MTGSDRIPKIEGETEAAPQYFFHDAFDALQSSYEAGFSNEDAEAQAQSQMSNERVGRQQTPTSQSNYTHTEVQQDQEVAVFPRYSSYPIDQVNNSFSNDYTQQHLDNQRITREQVDRRPNLHIDTSFNRIQQVTNQPQNTQYYTTPADNDLSNEDTILDARNQRSAQRQLSDPQSHSTRTESHGSLPISTHPQNYSGRSGQSDNAFSAYNTSSTVRQSVESYDYLQHTINFTYPRRTSSPVNIYGFEQPPPTIYESLPRSSLSSNSRNNSRSSDYQNENSAAPRSFVDRKWAPIRTTLPTPSQSTLEQPPLLARAPRQPVYRPSAPSSERSARYSNIITDIRQDQDRQRAAALANPPRPSLPPRPQPQPVTTTTATTTNPSNLAQLHHSSLASTYAGRRSAEARQTFPFACTACDKKYLYLNSAQKHWRMHHASVSATPRITERWAGAPSRPTPAIPRNAQAVQARGRQGRRSGVGAGAGVAGGVESVGEGNGGMAGQRALPAFDSGSSNNNNNSDGMVAPSTPTTLASAPRSQPFPPREVVDDGNSSLTWVVAAGRWYRWSGVIGGWEWWDRGAGTWR